MFCPDCGAPLNEGAAFCSNCGRRFNRDPMPQYNYQSAPYNPYQYAPQYSTINDEKTQDTPPAHTLAVLSKIFGIISVVLWAILVTFMQIAILGEL